MRIEDYLFSHISSHPELQAQDVLKFCYQAFFGPDHMLVDEKWAKLLFFDEYGLSRDPGSELYENLSDEFCRVDLQAWKNAGLDGDLLFSIFISSCDKRSGEEDFMQFLSCGCSNLIKTEFPRLYEPWKEYLVSYLKEGIHSMHHSIRYRNAYHPCYRVVRRALLPIL